MSLAFLLTQTFLRRTLVHFKPQAAKLTSCGYAYRSYNPPCTEKKFLNIYKTY